MERPKFLDGIILLAAAVADGSETGNSAGLIVPQDINETMLEDLLQKYVLPVARKVSSSSEVRKELMSPEVAPVLIRAQPVLMDVFGQYADVLPSVADDSASEAKTAGRSTQGGTTDDESDDDEPQMSSRGFLHMLSELGILGT